VQVAVQCTFIYYLTSRNDEVDFGVPSSSPASPANQCLFTRDICHRSLGLGLGKPIGQWRNLACWFIFVSQRWPTHNLSLSVASVSTRGRKSGNAARALATLSLCVFTPAFAYKYQHIAAQFHQD
jgi:hypothetical protein